ncbi:Cytochrome P450 CYP82D47 [Morella rubra]|uniref:Cytochrome P450 CYP82D47 n=1 Tax=Morella rubra TaxID=262757 RepID=A0A6A1UKR1_9ROSI|nr:Cytochrome P450 CYP82D47 [Morella rubra]
MIAGKRYFGNSKDRDDEETKHIAKTNRDFMYLAAAPVLSDLIPLLRWGDLQGQLESMKSIAREFGDLVGSWIEEHMRRLKSEPSNETDFIDVMLSVIEEDNLFGHTREQIVRATAVNLILAGSDSTSTNSTWHLSLLLNHKHALRRAQEELDLKVGRD